MNLNTLIINSIAAAKVNFVTVPEDVTRLGQRFRFGTQHSVVLAFHVGQT